MHSFFPTEKELMDNQLVICTRSLGCECCSAFNFNGKGCTFSRLSRLLWKSYHLESSPENNLDWVQVQLSCSMWMTFSSAVLQRMWTWHHEILATSGCWGTQGKSLNVSFVQQRVTFGVPWVQPVLKHSPTPNQTGKNIGVYSNLSCDHSHYPHLAEQNMIQTYTFPLQPSYSMPYCLYKDS